MVKVFSFVIYGNNEKYTLGLLKNIEIIQMKYPDFEIWIYTGSDVPENYITQYKLFDRVKIIETGNTGAKLMVNRFFPIDDEEVEICFIRDADSRIYERDQWCINEFIKSDKLFHIIRDHYWHKSGITGGMWGCKRFTNFKLSDLYDNWVKNHNDIMNNYGTDQIFLKDIIYPLVKDISLYHSDIIGMVGEPHPNPILVPHNNIHFVGQVYTFNGDDEITQFKYDDYPLVQHLFWLQAQGQWKLISNLSKDFDQLSIPYSQRYNILYTIYMSHFYVKNIEECQKALGNFRHTHIDDYLIRNCSCVFNLLKERYKIIGTTNLNRIPKDDEIIIYYGNYLHDIDCLPHSNKIYRHPMYYELIDHDEYEYDPIWEPVDIIYVLNLIDRKDRWYEILVELCRFDAPLGRIYHYKAVKETVTGDKTVDIYLGATKNHLDVTKNFLESGKKYCLILEDDLSFTSRINKHKEDLKLFFERDYVFDVAFISASKYHDIRPFDDLVSISYQECTTTSGYILNSSTAHKVLECFDEGYNQMKITKNYHKYVCDRYWTKLQKDNGFLLFNTKMGYQRPVYSSITNKVNTNFD